MPPGFVEKIDDMMKADLLEWHSFWFGWLLIATALVVVGLTLEDGELWYEMRSIARSKFRFFRYRTLVLERRVEWAKVIAFVGWILIVVGVAGEMFTEVMISDADRNIEAFDAIVLADARRESAFALERAAHAEATAKTFDVQIAQLEAKARSAEATAKGFEAQIAAAQRDAAESKKEAESERLARVTLQKELQPRRLSSEQKDKLAALVKPFAPVSIILEWTAAGGQESADLARDMYDAIVSAGIPIPIANRTILEDQYFKGVLLRIGNDRRGEAELIAGFLIDAKLSARPVNTLPPTNAQQLSIVVGSKP